jgi:thioesterase domain-containing protein
MHPLFENIAPALALGFSVADYSNGILELAAPLEANINDKETAFAGSISSLLVLAGWGAITLRLQEAGITAEVMVVENRVEYRRAVRSKLQARTEQFDAETLLADLSARQRGRVGITIRLYSEGWECAAMEAHYAVFIKE